MNGLERWTKAWMHALSHADVSTECSTALQKVLAKCISKLDQVNNEGVTLMMKKQLSVDVRQYKKPVTVHKI
jgi:hypothetical protein